MNRAARMSASNKVSASKVSVSKMPVSHPSEDEAASTYWIANQPYLLLSITSLCWAGNAIVGRFAAGHIPPGTLSFLGWLLAFLNVMQFAWNTLGRACGVIRATLGVLVSFWIHGI